MFIIPLWMTFAFLELQVGMGTLQHILRFDRGLKKILRRALASESCEELFTPDAPGIALALSGNIRTLSGNIRTLSGNVRALSGNIRTRSGNVRTPSGNIRTFSGKIRTLRDNMRALSGIFQA
jgi:hypothetical protein